MMYALDGEIIEMLDEVDKDVNLILVSSDKDNFKGIHNLKSQLTTKDLRIDNADLVKRKITA
jgi:hypothetical protein